MFICICIIYTKQNQKKFQCPTDNNNESAINMYKFRICLNFVDKA